ncbi:MAG: peptidyl-prolyl cis-trans isomerase [Tissierella sp.]|uniref:peptidyl-prolyl cis-trans isomerase n=1 Tax=Tissierella sp. TaxID=41274 RepID=UPI003F9B1F95
MVENKIVAKVNGKEISQQDVFKFLNEIDPQVASQFNTPEGIQKVIEELINQELIYLDAKENNVDEEKEYMQLLEDSKVALLKSYALNKLIADISVSEEELEKYYEEHKDYFKKPESRVASHILVTDEEEANKIYKEIEEGLSFEDAAKKYSTCPSKEKGGNLGEFSRGQMVPEFENEAFSMEIGVISKPVKSQFGYHIIRVEEKIEEQTRSFEEAKAEIQQQLLRLKQQEEYLGKIEKLEEKYKVEKFD